MFSLPELGTLQKANSNIKNCPPNFIYSTMYLICNLTKHSDNKDPSIHLTKGRPDKRPINTNNLTPAQHTQAHKITKYPQEI